MAPDSHEETRRLPFFYDGPDFSQTGHPRHIEAYADTISDDSAVVQPLQDHITIPAWFSDNLLQSLRSMCTDHTSTAASKNVAASVASHFVACRIASKSAAELSDYRDDLFDQTQAMLVVARTQADMLSHEYMYRKLRLDIIAKIHEQYVANSIAGIDCRQSIRCEQRAIGKARCKDRFDDCRADALHIWSPHPDSINSDDAHARLCDLTIRQALDEDAGTPLTADDIAHTRYHALGMLLDNKFSHQLYVEMMNNVDKAYSEVAAAAVTLSDMCNMLVMARNKAGFEQRRHENVPICNSSSVNFHNVLFGSKASTESVSASVCPDEILARLHHVRNRLIATNVFSSANEEEYHNLVLRVINKASIAVAAAQADVAAAKQKTAETETLYRTIIRAGVETKEATCARQASMFREAKRRLRIEKETYEHVLAKILGVDKMRILQAQIAPKIDKLLEADGGEVQLDNALKSIGTWYYAKQHLEVRRALEGENKSPPLDAPSSQSLQDQLVHANNEIGYLKHQVTVLTHQNNQFKCSGKHAAEDTHNFKIDAARRRAEFDFSQRLDAIVQNHLLEVQDLRDIASSTRNAMCALLCAITGTKTDGNTPLTVPSISELLCRRDEMRQQISTAFKDRIESLESQLAVYESGVLLVEPSVDGSAVYIAPLSAPDVACSTTSIELGRKLRALQDENRELHAQRASFETAALFDAPTPTGYREKKRLRDQRRRYEDKIARLHGAVELLMQIVHRVESKQVTELVNELLDIKSRLTEDEATCAIARNTLVQAAIDAETNKCFSMDLLNLVRHRMGQAETQMQDFIKMSTTVHKRLVRRLDHIIYTPESQNHMIDWLKNALLHAEVGFEDIENNAILVHKSVTEVLARIDESIADESGAFTKPKLYQKLQLKSLQLNHERKKAAHYRDMVRQIRADFAAHGTIDSSLKLLINEYIRPDFDDAMPVNPELKSIPVALETAETLASLYFSLKAENDASRRAIVMSRSMLADTATEAFRQRGVYKHMMLETEYNAAAQEKYYVEAFQEMRQCMLNARVTRDLAMQDHQSDTQLPAECNSYPESPDPLVQSCAEEEFSDLDDYEIIPMPLAIALSDDERGDGDDESDGDDKSDNDKKSGSKHAEESIIQESTYTSLAIICKLRNLVDVLITKNENIEQQLSLANAKIVSIGAELKEAAATSRVYESQAANLAILVMEGQYNVEKTKLSSIAYGHHDEICSTGGCGGNVDAKSMQKIKAYLDQGFQRLQCNSMLRIRELQKTTNKQQVTIGSLQERLDQECKLSTEIRDLYWKQRAQLHALKERVFGILVSTKNPRKNGAQMKTRDRHLCSSYLLQRYSSLAATLIKYFAKVFGNLRVNDIGGDSFSDCYPGIKHENSKALSGVCDNDTCQLKHRKAPSNTELTGLYGAMDAALQASYNRDVNATTKFLSRAQEIAGSLAASSTDLEFRDRMYSLAETLHTKDDFSRGNLIEILEQHNRDLAFDVYTDMDVEHLFAFEAPFRALAETFINERLRINYGDEESDTDSCSDYDSDFDLHESLGLDFGQDSDLNSDAGPNSNWESDSASDSEAFHNANDVED